MEANLSEVDTQSLPPWACLLFNLPGTKLGQCPFLGRPQACGNMKIFTENCLLTERTVHS